MKISQILTALALLCCGCAKDTHLEAKVNNQQDQLNSLQRQIDGLYSSMALQINAVNSGNAALQTAVQSTQAAIIMLQTSDSVQQYLDPCGPVAGSYNEVVLRTTSGKLVAFFESGSTRFLTILSAGNYITTDLQHCSFSVDAVGKLCDNTGCY